MIADLFVSQDCWFAISGWIIIWPLAKNIRIQSNSDRGGLDFTQFYNWYTVCYTGKHHNICINKFMITPLSRDVCVAYCCLDLG